MVKKFLSLVKFPHTVFALPFALVGFFLAVQHGGYTFSWLKFGLVLLCMVFARNAALAFNRYLDREIDKKNPRTAHREVPSGILSPQSVLLFTIANCVLFIITTYFINFLCFVLSPVALLVLLGYSYTKRYTSLAHIVLGLADALSVIGAYIAVSGQFDLLPILYTIAILFWVSGFDIIYALQDKEFDRKHNLYSVPAMVGIKNALILSAFFHILTAAFLIVPGLLAGFGLWYWLGTGAFIGLLTFQHIIVTPSDLSRVHLAFGPLNGYASVIFAIFMIVELFVDQNLFF